MTYQQFLDNLVLEFFTMDGELFDKNNSRQPVYMRLSLNYTLPWSREFSTRDDMLVACKRFWEQIQEEA